MLRTSRLRAVLGLVAAVLVLGPLPVHGQSGSCTVAAPRSRADGWVQIRFPDFPAGDPELLDYAVLPFTPNTIFAINDKAVLRTTDGGCLWEDVFVAGEQLAESLIVGELTLLSVEVAPSIAAARVVYVLATDGTRTVVLRSSDLGRTWDTVSVGLPSMAAGGVLRVTPNPAHAYALIYPTLGDNVPNHLYATKDAGATWRPVNTDLSPDLLDDFAVDAADPRALWAWNESTVLASNDSGATFRTVSAVRPPISTVDAYRFPPHKPARVVAFRADTVSAYQSRDGGATWKTIKVPGVVTSAAHTYAVDAFAMASDRGVWVMPPGGTTAVDASPRGLRLRNLQFGNLTPIVLHGQDDGAIYRRSFTPQVRPVVRPKTPALPPVNLRGGVKANIKESELTPRTFVRTLLPGQSAKQAFRLDLAPTPTDLDIYFTTDSTGSMSGLIGSLRESFQDIINELAASGINVWFGVGDFKDYPGFGSPTDYPHQRLSPVVPIGDDLRDALERLTTGGGNGLDSALASIYQAATGAGQPGVAPGSWLIQPGQGAEFRRDSLKVIVAAADVRSRDPESDPGYPGPSYRTVIRALNQRGVKLVGLAVGSDPEPPRAVFERLAEGTSTLAPEEGVDCDGDGELDLGGGDPMVCTLSLRRGDRSSIAPAMVGLLRGVADLQTVSLELVGDERVVRHLSAPAYEDIDVKDPNLLGFEVGFTCTPETMGETYPITLRALAGSRPVATATARITCALPAVPPREIPPPAQAEPRQIVAGVVPPPPPPPAPVPQPQPNPNPNPNPNPQPQMNAQANPNAGFAFEEQEQVQVALAHAELGLRDVEELAMVAVDHREPDTVPALLYAGAAMTALAGAALARHRSAAATVRAWLR